MSETATFQSSFFSVVSDGDVHILSITRDQLTEDDNLEQLGQDFSLLIEKYDLQRIVLVMNRVRYMTSSAIGKLITLHRRLNRSGGLLVLSDLTVDVAATLETSRLLTYFKSAPDSASALVLARKSD